MEAVSFHADEAPAPLGRSGDDEPERPSRVHLEIGFAVGALLACVVIGWWLLNLGPNRTPRPDEVLERPQPVATGTYSPAPVVRDTYRAVTTPTAGSVDSGRRAPVAASPAPPVSDPSAPGVTPARPSTPPRATPSATATPPRTNPPAPPAAGDASDSCIISVLGIRICLP